MTDTDFVAEHEEAVQAVDVLRTTTAIRQRCGQLLTRARAGESHWFVVDEGYLEAAAREIVNTTKHRFPRLHVPLHSQWRHFEAGGIDRKRQLDELLAELPPPQRTHSMIDLTVVSVLLDAASGPHWKYVEPATGLILAGPEGLAVASFHAFTAGLFSNDETKPYQADSEGLRALVTDHLASALQVSESNPIEGLEGRAVLLRRLGEVIQEQPEVFGEDPARPGGMFDMIISPLGPTAPPTADVSAHDILSQILMSLSGIWPPSNAIRSVPLGDCWRHEAVRGEGLTDRWVPFHKTSQWLTYSLLEPFAWGGVQVRALETLTALPEYRNGGLLIDSGLLRLRDHTCAQQLWQPGDEIIVEWRALTVALMDEIAVQVRKLLRMDEEQLPMARLLEGGSWPAGLHLAQRLRGGEPPLKVVNDPMLY